MGIGRHPLEHGQPTLGHIPEEHGQCLLTVNSLSAQGRAL